MTLLMAHPSTRKTGNSTADTGVQILILLLVTGLHLLIIWLWSIRDADLLILGEPKVIEMSLLGERAGQQLSNKSTQAPQLKPTKPISKKPAPAITKPAFIPKLLPTKPRPTSISAPPLSTTSSAEPALTSVSKVGPTGATQSPAQDGSKNTGNITGNAGAKVGHTSTVVKPRYDAGYLSNPEPEYPEISREMGEEGRVFLQVFVDAQGQAVQVHLHKSSRFERLDQAAIAAVKHWKFVPGRIGDEAVAAEVIVPVNFFLQ